MKVATFNARGLTSSLKREVLIADLAAKEVDICCIQETKTMQEISINDKDYKMFLLSTQNHHYGVGFFCNTKTVTVHAVLHLNERTAAIFFNY